MRVTLWPDARPKELGELENGDIGLVENHGDKWLVIGTQFVNMPGVFVVAPRPFASRGLSTYSALVEPRSFEQWNPALVFDEAFVRADIESLVWSDNGQLGSLKVDREGFSILMPSNLPNGRVWNLVVTGEGARLIAGWGGGGWVYSKWSVGVRCPNDPQTVFTIFDSPTISDA